MIFNFIVYTGFSTVSSYYSLPSLWCYTGIHVDFQIRPANEVVKMMLDHMTNTGNGTHIRIGKGTILGFIQIGIITVLIQT